jgi:acetylornithine deacetylase/succinyl-diaminopimelate desuccinylase-like protein
MYQEYLKLLKQFIKFKSISTDPQFKGEIENTVKWLTKLLENNGFKITIIQGNNHPIVLAEFIKNPSLETCLVYGHYDVQPANINEGWENDPFEILEKEDKLIARGIVDNKGQISIHIFTILELIKQDKLNYNIKFFIEGEEELGSPGLEEIIKNNKDILKADFFLLSDGTILANHPAIEVSLRGIANITLSLQTSDKELHSGIYGSSAPNAIHEMSKFISNLYDKNNKINIDNFYDDIKVVSEFEKENNKKIPFDIEEYKRNSGTKVMLNEEGLDFRTQVGLRPAVNVVGVVAGYNGSGYKTSIPNIATAKFNFRLVDGQDNI